jgi:hypothetical protein
LSIEGAKLQQVETSDNLFLEGQKLLSISSTHSSSNNQFSSKPDVTLLR